MNISSILVMNNHSTEMIPFEKTNVLYNNCKLTVEYVTY